MYYPRKMVYEMSPKQIIEIAEILYVSGWRYDDRARFIVRYGLTGREADLIVAALRLYE